MVGLVTGNTGKQISKQTTIQIEFSDAFKTKIGSCKLQKAKNLYSKFSLSLKLILKTDSAFLVISKTMSYFFKLLVPDPE